MTPRALTASASLVSLTLLGALGCGKSQMIDLAMASAPRPTQRHMRVGPYDVLAGDMHCHVLPPDAPYHVSRDLPQTLGLAREEGLDFVILTPHVPARFFQDPEMRTWVLTTQRRLRSRVAALTAADNAGGLVVIPGMEYTDHRFGHVGLAFADVAEVLDEIAPADLLSRPELFFERWRANGGLATINHPVLRPIPRSAIAELRYDLSWRGFTRADSVEATDVFPEIRWLSEHAESIETYNTSIGHLRDQFMIGDADWTMREGTHLADRIARTQERRLTPVGGSDSHGDWLRPTTWLLAKERTPAAIRDAIVHGRSCVRGPEGCSLEVRGGDGAFHFVGASIASASEGTMRSVEARAHGGAATYFVNGAIATTGGDGELVRIPMPGRCALVRVEIGRSASAPVHVDCPWASSPVH